MVKNPKRYCDECVNVYITDAHVEGKGGRKKTAAKFSHFSITV